MRQIAQEAGIALGGIYNHFASKEEIFVETLMIHHPIHDMLPAMQNAVGATVEEFVRDAAQKLVESIGKRPEFLNLMFIELVEFNGQHLPQIFQMIFPKVMLAMQRFLQNESQLRAIPLPILLRAFLGLFFSYIMTEMLIGGFLPAEMQANALEHFVDIFLHGVLKPGEIHD